MKHLKKILAIILLIGFNFCLAQKGSLKLEGTIYNENKKSIGEAEITIEYNDYIIKLSSDMDGNFNMTLKPGIEYKIYFSKTKYKSKLISVYTINSGNYESGYEIPVEVILERGKNNISELQPVGVIYYNKKTDLYEVGASLPPTPLPNKN